MEKYWIEDSIMKGWRFVITDNGNTFRSASMYRRMVQIEANMYSAVKKFNAGQPTYLQQTGEREYTLPCVL